MIQQPLNGISHKSIQYYSNAEYLEQNISTNMYTHYKVVLLECRRKGQELYLLTEYKQLGLMINKILLWIWSLN